MKPMLFDTEMVQALLAGRKTATRRAVKLHHLHVLDSPYHWEHPETPEEVLIERLCEPPCCPGDILYVRETWAIVCTAGTHHEYAYKADNEWLVPLWRPSIHMPKAAARIFLRVTDVRVERLQKMEIADFKAEGILPRRPKDLSGHGCDCVWKHDGCLESPCADRDAYEYLCWVDTFLNVWDSTIKAADIALYGWGANPWVWVIEFERISKEEAIYHA